MIREREDDENEALKVRNLHQMWGEKEPIAG
jgi:hypothetical protein